MREGIMNLKLHRVISHPKVMDMCKIPYHGNPKGCPMYDKRSRCPPRTKMFDEIIVPPYFLIIQDFDLETQMKKMKDRHSDWSDKQCANTRYWQKGFDGSIKREADQFITEEMKDGVILVRPEAYGVNLFATCAHHGIILKRRYPLKVVKKMVMVGRNKDSVKEFFE